jgi:hypothetical protein
MSLAEDAEILRNVPLFAKIDPTKLKSLASTSERLAYPSGDELFHEGDQATLPTSCSRVRPTSWSMVRAR